MPEFSAQQRLDNLLSPSGVSLDRLGVDQLLVELLKTVRELLDADTAAVLLVDHGGDQLVARAAVGVEEEVRQGVRVPVGEGFAGAIAATKRPIALDHIGPATVTNPILWEKGIRVMLGVPLLSGGELVGVLHVGRLDDRRFGQSDIELLVGAADRVTSAVHVHQLAMERAAADLLERSLLPPRLPDCPGLAFAARYVTAEDRAVGGDWYDAFTLPSRTLWVVIGDVAGHGLPAAVVMGRVRSAMRSYALEDYPADQVLRLVDRKVRHFEVGAMVTVACATSTPPYEQFEIATAGHPPPALAIPEHPTVLLDLDVMPPLGIQSDIRCPPTIVQLPAGSVLVFYTDGLVERRGEDLDHRLASLCTAIEADHPETVCRTVMHDMIGSYTPEDDVAILAVRRTS